MRHRQLTAKSGHNHCLLNHLVRAEEQRRKDREAERQLCLSSVGAQALTLIRKLHPLGRLVAQALPQSWNCKIKEGTQLQRDLPLARVDNADRHRRWLIRLQQSD